MTQNPNSIVIQSLRQQAKNLLNLTLIFFTLILTSCTPYTDPFPSTDRAIYPTECDYSPIEFGTLTIYNTDSTFLHSIDLDHQHTPTGTYYIDLENVTYIFKLHSNYTKQTATFTISINPNTTNFDLNICNGQ